MSKGKHSIGCGFGLYFVFGLILVGIVFYFVLWPSVQHILRELR